MDEPNSSQPAKCPCGFWGSSKTLGLCSRCYKEDAEKSNIAMDTNSTPLDSSQQTVTKPELLRAGTSTCRLSPTATTMHPRGTTSPDPRALFTNRTADADFIDADSTPLPATPPDSLYQLPLRLSAAECQKIPALVATHDTNNSAERKDNGKRESSAAASSDPAGKNKESEDDKKNDKNHDADISERRGTKRSRSNDDSCKSPSSSTNRRTPQKNKKRCHKCSCKLNIAQRAIGRCKCDYIFCSLHRMPEQHDCDFDHKEEGRREAKKKMVKPRRHVGTNCKRIDSETT